MDGSTQRGSKFQNVCILLGTVCFLFLGCMNTHAQDTGAENKEKKNRKNKIEEPKPLKGDTLFRSVRGRIVDQVSKGSLPGASVRIFIDTSRYIGATTNAYGYFEIPKVAIGRHALVITYVGYRAYETSILVSASNDVELNIDLEEQSSELKGVVVQATAIKENPIGGITINIDDIGRLPGTRGEAIRSISQNPGTQPNSDSRNDVVIRGNAPGSVLWRLHGVNIPNPNHFNIAGTAGGPVTFINDKMLGEASFYSGTFPAAYGNTVAGIFDLNFRSGSNTKFSGNLQAGVLGIEASVEGPISKNKEPSYLVTLRKSAMSMFYKVGIDVGTEAIPNYRDASFNLNFPQKKGANISVFGLGGSSDIDILVSQGHRNFYGEKDRDQYFHSAAGILGVNYKQTIDTAAFITTTLAFSTDQIKAHHDFVFPKDLRDQLLSMGNPGNDLLPPVLQYEFREKRILYAITYTKKLKRKGEDLSWGLNVDLYLFNYFDSARSTNESQPNFGIWRTRWDSRDESVLLQPFIQRKFIAGKFDILAGLHSQYFSLSKSYSPVEPRVVVKYNLGTVDGVKYAYWHSLNFGLGLHSQIQAPYIYFYGATNTKLGKPILQNRAMDFTRSWHGVLGYEYILNRETTHIRFKLEAYYQYLFNVPVDRNPSTFSFLNTGASFTRLYPEGELINSGKGKNYGLELTIDKAFSNNNLFLITGSIFQSLFTGSDGIWRNTDLNGKYTFNALYTHEWEIKRSQNIFSMGGRITMIGGRWYGPVNHQETMWQKTVVFDDATKNTQQFKHYFRADIRISYKINRNKVTHEFAVDWINVLNTKNILRLEYQPGEESSNQSRVVQEYQLGMIPFFYWRIAF